jgi:quinol monooxygenase YgiN
MNVLLPFQSPLLSALPILLSTATLIGVAGDGPARAQTPAATIEGPLTAVAYVEVKPASAATARAALQQYLGALGKTPSAARVELFEQVGRAGHFAIVETWHDQAAFDARDAAARSRLTDALAPIRVSAYDERPYKTLTTAPAAAPAANRGTLYVITHVDVVPNPQAPELLRRLADASRADDGNLRFDVVQYAVRANHFTVIEHWRDQQALDSHVAAAHTRQYRDELQPLTGSPLDERLYTAVE